MSEPCSVCGTDLKKPYKHTRIASVSSMEWKDYNKKNPKVKHTEKPGTIITYACSYNSFITQECTTDEEE